MRLSDHARTTEPATKVAIGALGVILGLIVITTFLPRDWTLPLPAPLDDPRAWPLILLMLLVPALFATAAFSTWLQVHRARRWPQTNGRVVSATVAVQHSRTQGESTRVTNVPAIQYEYTVAQRHYHGTRISFGSPTQGTWSVRATLARFPVGANVTVYYDPANPARSTLDRGLPVTVIGQCVLAIAFLIACSLLALVALHPDASMELLQQYLPERAEPQAALFFTAAGLLTTAIAWSNQREAMSARRWPVVRGRIVRSEVESYTTFVGSSNTGGRSVRLFQPVTEYEYTVDGCSYHGDCVALGAQVAGAESFAREQAARYGPDQAVDVHYDPRDPSHALLETSVAAPILTAGIILIFLALAMYFSGLLALGTAVRIYGD